MYNLSEIMSWPYIGLVATFVMAAILGLIAYSIASRKSKHSALSFLGRYGAWFFAFFFLECFVLLFLPSIHSAMRSSTAAIVSGIFTLANVPHGVAGSTILLQDPYLAFDISAACLGGILLWAYAALVLAEPGVSTRQRVIGILVGFVILITFNLFRIVLSIYLQWLTGTPVHDYFYLFNVVVVILVWAGWLRSTKSRMILKNA